MATAASARRWLENFAAVEEADRRARRLRGARPTESVALSLSLLEAAWTASGGRLPADSRRAEREETVRAVWDRLHSRTTSSSTS